MSDLTLRDLAEERVALDALLAMDEGEMGADAEFLEAELVKALVLKADAFGSYVRELEATADALDDEITRLYARRSAILNRAERLKRYALMALQTMDRPRVEGTLFTLAVTANPPKVRIETETINLPTPYVRLVPASTEPDRAAISKALKAGVEIPGCSLETTYRLRIA